MAELKLPAELDVRCIDDVHQGLAIALSGSSRPFAIDASAVTRIDTAGVQLLAAALQASGADLTIVDPADVVIGAFDALGLGHLLNH